MTGQTDETMEKARKKIQFDELVLIGMGKTDPMKAAAFAQINVLQERIDTLEKGRTLSNDERCIVIGALQNDNDYCNEWRGEIESIIADIRKGVRI